MNQLVQNLRASTFNLAPLSPTIGAEVDGIDLTLALSEIPSKV